MYRIILSGKSCSASYYLGDLRDTLYNLRTRQSVIAWLRQLFRPHAYGERRLGHCCSSPLQAPAAPSPPARPCRLLQFVGRRKAPAPLCLHGSTSSVWYELSLSLSRSEEELKEELKLGFVQREVCCFSLLFSICSEGLQVNGKGGDRAHRLGRAILRSGACSRTSYAKGSERTDSFSSC
jgi:hypothetical protein